MSALAATLLDAYDRGAALAPPSRTHADFQLADGYRVAAELIDARRRRGERLLGRKIGFSNRAIWPRYGVHGPIWGAVWDSTLVQLDGPHATVSLAGLVEPRLEPEIVIGLRCAPRSSSLEGLTQAVDWVAHGFEIVQSLYPNWQFTAADTVAAFGLHARLLVGPRVPARALGQARLADLLAALSLELQCDGQPVETGSGGNALGGPLQALGFLVDALAAQPELPALEAGELVTTGTLTDAQPLVVGQRWRTEIQGIALSGLTLDVSA